MSARASVRALLRARVMPACAAAAVVAAVVQRCDGTPDPAVPAAVAADAAAPPAPAPAPAPPRGRLVVLPPSRALTALLTVLRDETTPHGEFASAADRVMRLLAEEGLAQLPSVAPTSVRTPTGAVVAGLAYPPDDTIAVVSIVRAGDSLLDAVRRIAPGVAVGKVLIQRNEASPAKEPVLYYVKLPADVAQRAVLLVDPMLATGGSATMALRELVARGVPQHRILFLNVVACPEGIAHLRREYPGVTIVTAVVDGGLNEHMYIVPGLGDFGDRFYGTEERGAAARPRSRRRGAAAAAPAPPPAAAVDGAGAGPCAPPAPAATSDAGVSLGRRRGTSSV